MTTLLALVVPILFFLGLAVSTWYVDARLRTSFGLGASRWPARVVTALSVVGIVAVVGATATSANSVAGVLYTLGGYFFTFYLYLFLALLCLHPIQRLWRPVLVRTGAALALTTALVATGFGAFWAGTFSVNETEIRIAGLDKPVTVMQISDVHLGHHRGGEYLTRIVQETNRHRPDLVLITGDLVDSNAALLQGVLDPLSGFMAPVYFVSGNHETYIDTARAFDLISRNGVKILHNEMVETHGLQLIGLDYMKADDETFDMHPSDDPRTIKSVLAGLPINDKTPSVLMHHSPVGLPYIEDAGIDLMLSGHTHAGQVFPATLIAQAIFPFNRGLYAREKTQVFVSQGAGTFLQRIRLGVSNEIDLIRLLPDS